MLHELELPKLGALAKNIIFHGAISFNEIPNAYAKAEVCVFPSHMETLGLVAPEAMAMEKAVVFTNKGPGPEVVFDEINGLLCNPHEPFDIANKICWVLENGEKVGLMRKKARIDVLKRFDIAILVEMNIQFYKNLL
jgi:glycosyltransferase involved in cell wall biosynthesis